MSFSEHEPNMQLFEQDLGFSADTEVAIRHEILHDADRKELKYIKTPFNSPIMLMFDEGLLLLQLEPWKNELMPLPESPILAKIEFVSADAVPGLGPDDVDKRIILDGASIMGTNSVDDLGVIARNCNLSYRKTTMREMTFFDPLESGKMLRGKRFRKQRDQMQDLLQTGWAREVNGKILEICPSLDGSFTPPVRQLLETDDALAVFPEND